MSQTSSSPSKHTVHPPSVNATATQASAAVNSGSKPKADPTIVASGKRPCAPLKPISVMCRPPSAELIAAKRQREVERGQHGVGTSAAAKRCARGRGDPLSTHYTSAGGGSSGGAPADKDVSDEDGGRGGGEKHGDNGALPAVYGIFHPEKYLAGEDCIDYQGNFITRSKFERLGGSLMAKWYRSIRVVSTDEPLGAWLTRRGLPLIKGKPRTRRHIEEHKGAVIRPGEVKRNPEPAPLKPEPALESAAHQDAGRGDDGDDEDEDEKEGEEEGSTVATRTRTRRRGVPVLSQPPAQPSPNSEPKSQLPPGGSPSITKRGRQEETFSPRGAGDGGAFDGGNMSLSPAPTATGTAMTPGASGGGSRSVSVPGSAPLNAARAAGPGPHPFGAAAVVAANGAVETCQAPSGSLAHGGSKRQRGAEGSSAAAAAAVPPGDASVRQTVPTPGGRGTLPRAMTAAAAPPEVGGQAGSKAGGSGSGGGAQNGRFAAPPAAGWDATANRSTAVNEGTKAAMAAGRDGAAEGTLLLGSFPGEAVQHGIADRPVAGTGTCAETDPAAEWGAAVVDCRSPAHCGNGCGGDGLRRPSSSTGGAAGGLSGQFPDADAASRWMTIAPEEAVTSHQHGSGPSQAAHAGRQRRHLELSRGGVMAGLAPAASFVNPDPWATLGPSLDLSARPSGPREAMDGPIKPNDHCLLHEQSKQKACSLLDRVAPPAPQPQAAQQRQQQSRQECAPPLPPQQQQQQEQRRRQYPGDILMRYPTEKPAVLRGVLPSSPWQPDPPVPPVSDAGMAAATLQPQPQPHPSLRFTAFASSASCGVAASAPCPGIGSAAAGIFGGSVGDGLRNRLSSSGTLLNVLTASSASPAASASPVGAAASGASHAPNRIEAVKAALLGRSASTQSSTGAGGASLLGASLVNGASLGFHQHQQTHSQQQQQFLHAMQPSQALVPQATMHPQQLEHQYPHQYLHQQHQYLHQQQQQQQPARPAVRARSIAEGFEERVAMLMTSRQPRGFGDSGAPWVGPPATPHGSFGTTTQGPLATLAQSPPAPFCRGASLGAVRGDGVGFPGLQMTSSGGALVSPSGLPYGGMPGCGSGASWSLDSGSVNYGQLQPQAPQPAWRGGVPGPEGSWPGYTGHTVAGLGPGRGACGGGGGGGVEFGAGLPGADTLPTGWGTGMCLDV